MPPRPVSFDDDASIKPDAETFLYETRIIASVAEQRPELLMPHLIADRSRLLALAHSKENLPAQAHWEYAQAILYKIGGLGFVVGSVFFFPALEKLMNVGAWTFFAASILYLIVSAHDLLEVRRYRKTFGKWTPEDWLEWMAAFFYFWGTILFLIGSILFLSWIGQTAGGAWCFIIGSLFFVIGSTANILLVPAQSKRGNLQLVNLTAVTFAVGSVLFTVASVPYLWNPATEEGQRTLDGFLAWQYLMGSFLFLFGGLTNFWRSRRMIHEQMQGCPEHR